MMKATAHLSSSILRLAETAQRELDERFRSSAALEPTSALNQAGLRNGLGIVEDFLGHNEFGCAFEHVVYLLVEPGIALTQSQFKELIAIGEQLALKPSLWNRVGVVEPT
ncbi:MAG: hypothetical protein QM756_43000 [Polyangiaceae bacterium]